MVIPAIGACSSSDSSGGSADEPITVGAAQAVTTLNPVLKANAWEQTLFSLMWDGLVKFGEDGKIGPDLATTWSSSDDLKTWTFELREDVVFSNGKKLTADDVVETVEYYQDPETATQLKNNVAPITDVTAGNPTEVVFSLDAANALFPESIEMLKIIDTESLPTIETDPAVTGPYKVKDFVSDDHLTLVRNEDYFGDADGAEEIRLVKAADASAAVTALQSRDLDVLWSVPLSQVASIEKTDGLQVIKPDVIGQYVSWEVDMTSPPFDDPKARQALAYAIDREAILASAYFGQGVVSPTNNPLTENNPSYGGDLTDYSYDLDKAKALFADAGITDGDSLTWWGVSNQYPEWNTSAQILQESLKEIGITLEIKNNDIASWPSTFYPAGKSFPGLIVPNFQSYLPQPSDALLFLQSGRCECNWNSEEFDAGYKAAVATADAADRDETWKQLQTMGNAAVPIFVPVQFATVSASQSSVSGLWVDGGGTLHLENAKAGE